LYKDTQFGEKKSSSGIISFVVRTHKDFYKKGVKIIIINKIRNTPASILSYNGDVFKPLPDLKINDAIVRQFKAKNFVSAYVPDYGAIVFNTVNEDLLKTSREKFLCEPQLKKRLNMLISAIEMASLAHIGLAKGRQAAHIIWRKEKSLRKTALQLKNKGIELDAQKEYLRAVGAVNEKQLNMDAVNITNGVYAFMDMVGSATIRKKLSPGDYFFMLNLCHQIAANNANRYSCRVDNFIGDCVFLQSASPFDDENAYCSLGAHERIMLMVFALSSIFNEINFLRTGQHHLDQAGRVKKMMDKAEINISFRAGLEKGPAVIGPLGSRKRKIVTAIGKAVNNASRLESSGVPEWIHVSENVMSILKDAYITKDTKIIRRIILETESLKNNKNSGGQSFLDSYKMIFGIRENVIREQKNSSYKEFSKDISYLIKCMPGH